jgi:DNA-binding LacI/PurR family transcriptional regulator
VVSRPRVVRQHGIPAARSTGHHGERQRGRRRIAPSEGTDVNALTDAEMNEHDNAGRRRPTIRDIARRAGVSKSLVSLVMRGEPRVREEKRSRVLAAAEELGYPMTAAARAMSSTQSMTVGILIADLRNPVLVDIARRAEEVLYDAGLGTVLTGAVVPSPGPTGQRIVSQAIGALRALRVEALLVVGSVPDVRPLIDSAGDVPMVVAATQSEGLRADVVRDDDELGMRLVIDYLVAHGHRSIAHLGGQGGGVAHARALGYRAAMRHHGLEDQIVIADSDFSEDAGYRATAQLLRRNHAVTAIAALNDLAGVGALSAIADAGLGVPHDLAVTGYDDTFIAAVRQVSLTSVNPDVPGIGALAARCIVERIGYPNKEPEEYLLAPRLTIRFSASTSAASSNVSEGR